MAITAPYSLELRRNDDAGDAVAGIIANPSAGYLKIFLGDDVDPGKVQSIVGTLTCCFNVLLEEHYRKFFGAATCAAYAPLGGTAMDVTVNKSGITGIGDGDVAITVSGNFLAQKHQGGTHFLEETFEQLLEVLLENTKDN